MNIHTAVTIFNKAYPNRKVIGYWDNEEGFVLNTCPPGITIGLAEPAQFVVTPDNKVYATNPFRSNLDPSKIKYL